MVVVTEKVVIYATECLTQLQSHEKKHPRLKYTIEY